MMSVNEYVKNVLGINLLEYQKELLRLLETSPKGYLGDVCRKNPNPAVKQVVHVFERYKQDMIVGV